jgi:hypothetical protein
VVEHLPVEYFQKEVIRVIRAGKRRARPRAPREAKTRNTE